MDNYWISELINYWIDRCDVKNNINNENIEKIYLILNNNNIGFHNFVLSKGNYENNDFKCEYDDNIIFTNDGAKVRLFWYNDFFKKINNNYDFKFLLSHLDCHPKLECLNNIKMICFCGSSPNIENNNCIPILDAHHLFEHKKNVEYNPNHILDFNNDDFKNKINKINWRGGLYPTFKKKELELLHLRKEVCEKYIKNKNFDVGYVGKIYYNDYPLLEKNRMSYKEMTSYKYILNIDGFGASYDGTVWKLRSTSLVIWITDENNEMYWLQWYYPLLKPYVHYVPSSIDNLEKTFEWCENNQEKCIEIIKSSTELIENILSNTEEYHKGLFDKLNEIYIQGNNNIIF